MTWRSTLEAVAVKRWPTVLERRKQAQLVKSCRTNQLAPSKPQMIARESGGTQFVLGIAGFAAHCLSLPIYF